jgi:stage IV sporulation protein B
MFIIAMAAAVYLGGCTAFIIYFPSQIVLTEHNTHQLPISHDSPFRAVFQKETAAVFKISDSPLTIETEEQGTAEMTINAFGFPLKRVTLDIIPDVDVIPCGMTIGVRINTDGVLVLGTNAVLAENGEKVDPSGGKFKPGDLILSVNGTLMRNKEDFQKVVADSNGDLTFHIRRDETEMDITITPVRAAKNGVNHVGVWVRDSTKGIGTITYYNPVTKVVGALGHGIMDVDTKQLMRVKNGWIMSSRVTSVKKGAKGTPGELEGSVQKERIIGQIKANTPCGIYGVIDTALAGSLPRSSMKIATKSLIREGPATILTNVSSNEVKEYDIVIESVNRLAADETKGMVIRITDPELLRQTNGIVQGMSGSPIIQNGRLAGAVTHVFVQDPAKGYAIFIENMMNQRVD